MVQGTGLSSPPEASHLACHAVRSRSRLAALIATVLLPWAVFPALAFYGDFVVAWLTGALVRVLLTAAMVSIGLPLFQGLKFTLSSGGDPHVL